MEEQTYTSFQNFLSELSENCLFLSRHGETDWNAMKIIQGQQDRPLNATGLEQRKNLFSLLHPISLNRIYCSTLKRTSLTAIPISIEKKIKIEKRAELNEVSLGIFEGQHKEKFIDALSKKRYKLFLNDEINIAPPGGGESLRMVDKRVCNWVTNCIESVMSSGNVLVVGHRNVNKMIIKNLMGLSLEEGSLIEHKNSWLYIYCPNKSEIFLLKIPTPKDNIRIKRGYERYTKEDTQCR
jgi:probable phosphoglycerate mutase